MVSFYFMTPVFGLVYAGLRQVGVSVRPLSAKLLVLLLLPLFLDGITHMMNDTIWGISSDGFRDTNVWLVLLTADQFPKIYAGDHFGTFNWWMRLLSGLMAAIGLAFYLFPRLDNLLRREAERTCGSDSTTVGLQSNAAFDS